MLRFTRCVAVLMMAMLLCTACAAPPAPTVVSSPAATPSTTEMFPPTPSAASVVSPVPSPTATAIPDPPSLSLGAPQWLGRGQIVEARFTADCRLLVVGWAKGVSVWSAEAGAERWWQPTNTSLIAVDVEPHGRAVAALLYDGSVAVFDAATGDARRFKGGPGNVFYGDIAWSPNGERIAFQGINPGRGDPIYLLDPQSGAVQEVPETRTDGGPPPNLIWSPDGESITLTRPGPCSTLVDVRTGEEGLTLQSGDACYLPWALAWSPDGRTIAAVQGDRLDLLDAQSGQPLRSLEGGVRELLASGFGCALAFSSDGRRLVSWGIRGPRSVGWVPLSVWDVATGQALGQLQDPPERAGRRVVGLDGDSLISLFSNGEIARRQVGADEAEETIIDHLPVLVAEPWLAWSADGSRLAVAGYGGLAAWDTATALPLATFGPELSVPALSADGRLLAMTDTGRRQEVIYDLAAGAVMRTLPGASPILQGAAFSPDGRLIAYGAGSRALVAEVATGRVLAELAGYPEEQAIARVVWAPDSSALVVASGKPHADNEAGPVILWQRGNDGSFREAFRTQSVQTSYYSRSMALFSPDGALVALEDVPSFDGGQMSVMVFDRRSGKTVRRLKDCYMGAWASADVLLAEEAWYPAPLVRWNVQSGEKTVGRGQSLAVLSYAPGGTYYAKRPGDPGLAIEVLDWGTGRLICSAYHSAELLHISWSPDGHKMASLATNGTIAVWTVQDGPCERW